MLLCLRKTAPGEGLPFQFGDSTLDIESEAPHLGEQTLEVLQRVADYSVDEIKQLQADGIVQMPFGA